MPSPADIANSYRLQGTPETDIPDAVRREMEMKMSKSKHTPGPWRVIIDDDGNPLSGRPSISASDELDCDIVHWDGFVQAYWRSARGDAEIHANARLIAAAPDMFDVLKTFVAHYPIGVNPNLDEAYQAARAALSRAEGGQHE